MKVDKRNLDSGFINLQLRVSKGDEQAFEEIYLYFHKKLTSFARNFVRSHEIAEEIVGDVFIKLWSRREDIVNIQNLTVYLYSATKNRSLNALTKEARRFVTESLDLTDPDSYPLSSTPHDLLVTSEIMQTMRQAIELLPARCKVIFQLIREDGLKYKEVSEILNISVHTIDAQMAIAIKRLCAAMGVDRAKKGAAAAVEEKK